LGVVYALETKSPFPLTVSNASIWSLADNEGKIRMYIYIYTRARYNRITIIIRGNHARRGSYTHVDKDARRRDNVPEYYSEKKMVKRTG